jgi:hypothetical protein
VIEPFAIELPVETRRVLGSMAQVGVLGGTPEEVAAYLVLRGLDDIFRTGTLKLESEPVSRLLREEGCEHGVADIFDCPKCAPF